ncbi:MAG: ribosome biogenesis GTP-binding protein YihA/YsxC [Nitrospiria bacterium]
MKLSSVEYIKGCVAWEEGPRDGLPEIAMIGRSNVGKSSLINYLLGRKIAYISRTPGKTQLIHFFKINRAFYLVDLPGYGYARVPKEKRLQWGPMIESYLSKREPLRAVVLLIDIRHPDQPLDRQVKEWLDAIQVTTLFVATKGDKITRSQRKKQADEVKRSFGISNLIITSTQKGEGKEGLWKEIEAVLSKRG